MTTLSGTIRLGILSSAHLHCASYVSSLRGREDATITGIWDDDTTRGESFAAGSGIEFFSNIEELLDQVDAVMITSENHHHLPLTIAAAKAGKHILCEKPVVAREKDIEPMKRVIEESGVIFMTAFPCRFSPAFLRLKERIGAGEIGDLVAINATNRGTCPFGWFVKPELSGGGALIDHVVHVTDLLRNLLNEEVSSVQAQLGSNIYHEDWEDTAMVTMNFPSGIFATLDSSWSRPKNFKTWGDVTLTAVGSRGVIEMDMFGPGLDVYRVEKPSYSSSSYGSNLDGAMVEAFLNAVRTNSAPPVTLKDGIEAARVALAGYASVTSGQPVML